MMSSFRGGGGVRPYDDIWWQGGRGGSGQMMTFDDMQQFPLGFKYFLFFKIMTIDDGGEGGHDQWWHVMTGGEGGSNIAKKMMMSYMTAPLSRSHFQDFRDFRNFRAIKGKSSSFVIFKSL